MLISRGGVSLNQLLSEQKLLAEEDARIQSTRRAYNASPGDADLRKKLINSLRRVGDHEGADEIHLGHHASKFADASKRAHKAELAVRAHYRKHSGLGADDAENEWDKAHSSLEGARDALHSHAGRALHARGADNPMHKAKSISGRYRVIMAHGAKHLPKTDNWEDEHTMLTHYHDGHGVGRSVRGGFQHMRVETPAKRHALVHSLASRNPNLDITHNSSEDGHHVMVALKRKSYEPFQFTGGHVRSYGPNGTTHADSRKYLNDNPPHGS